MISSAYFIRIISKNLKKYNSTEFKYSNKMCNSLLLNRNTHFVTLFKDYLLYDDINEFLFIFFPYSSSLNFFKVNSSLFGKDQFTKINYLNNSINQILNKNRISKIKSKQEINICKQSENRKINFEKIIPDSIFMISTSDETKNINTKSKIEGTLTLDLSKRLLKNIDNCKDFVSENKEDFKFLEKERKNIKIVNVKLNNKLIRRTHSVCKEKIKDKKEMRLKDEPIRKKSAESTPFLNKVNEDNKMDIKRKRLMLESPYKFMGYTELMKAYNIFSFRAKKRNSSNLYSSQNNLMGSTIKSLRDSVKKTDNMNPRDAKPMPVVNYFTKTNINTIRHLNQIRKINLNADLWNTNIRNKNKNKPTVLNKIIKITTCFNSTIEKNETVNLNVNRNKSLNQRNINVTNKSKNKQRSISNKISHPKANKTELFYNFSKIK